MRLDHRQGFLAGGRRIQVNQRHTGVHLAFQDGKLRPDRFDVELITRHRHRRCLNLSE